MVNKLYVIILINYFVIFNTLVMSSSWDFAVTTNGKILFYDSNWKQTTAAAHQFNHLSAIAFDEIDELLYFNDQKEKDGTIYSVTLSDKSINHQIETILEKTKDEKIEGLAYDPLDRILYWTDSNNKMIYQLKINDNNNNNNNNNNNTNSNDVKIFKKLNDNEFPSGISIDICRRRIYWTNINEDEATIEWASLLNGSNESKIIIREKLYRPYGIVVDQYSERIYWVDNKEGIHYSVESAALDGTDRQILLYHYNSEPFNLAVDNYYVYFTDNSDNRIWKILKNATDNYSPERLVDHSASLRGIVTRTHLLSTQESNPACKLVIEKIKTSIKLYSSSPSSSSLSSNTSSMTTALKSSPNTVIIDKWNTSIRIDDNKSIDKLQDKKSVILILCLNNGTFNERSGRCICSKEFKGIYCEIPKCHNYCIHGTCSISTTGYEECHCNVGYVGDHCEINKCTGYCLNDGHCNYEDNQPVCQCTQKYFGRHCEMNIDICTEFCEKIVSIDIETKLILPDGCNCNEYNTNNINKIDKNEDDDKNNNNDNYNHNNNNNNYDNNNNKFNNNNNNKSATLLQLLEDNTSKSSCINNTSINRTAIFVSCGVVVSLLLVYLIIKSARQIYKPLRPRIKKTYVVRKNVNPTPLTSRPSTEQCEITIENCCNMNYCDTPCFDPQKLQEEMSKNQSRKEDKKTLLDNIEGELY